MLPLIYCDLRCKDVIITLRRSNPHQYLKEYGGDVLFALTMMEEDDGVTNGWEKEEQEGYGREDVVRENVVLGPCVDEFTVEIIHVAEYRHFLLFAKMVILVYNLQINFQLRLNEQ